ncbi:MAG: DNA-protecting protein DprA [Planctomycetes bacterium]|nr:DNA-protecting protein DprA [Planctomycetota bacterium]
MSTQHESSEDGVPSRQSFLRLEPPSVLGGLTDDLVDNEHFDFLLEEGGTKIDSSDVEDSSLTIDTLPDIPVEDRDAFLRLALVPGIGPKTMLRLLQSFSSAGSVLSATLSQLSRVHRVGPKLASAIREASHDGMASRILDHCHDHSIDILLPWDRTYPKLLKEIQDPPLVLFAKGAFRASDSLAIGIVGTRHATHYGRQMAERVTTGLCNYQMTIVSGLARGIDAVCHRAAIEASGRTIAVLGGSVSEIYPPEHKDLAQQVSENGVLLSETPPFSKPKAGVFPQRNRIISGLSLGVVVVEAANRSGSLITARHAGEQGRDVFAIPGPVTSRTSRGCHQLIRDGAILIEDADDVIEHLGPMAFRTEVGSGVVVHKPSELQLNEIEQKVLMAIDAQSTDIDLVISRSALPVPRVLSTISVLELKGLVSRSGGRTLLRR